LDIERIKIMKKGIRKNKQGMELVQVAILIAIAVALGLIFKAQIGAFVDNVFGELLGSDF
jgi:hypothetical protein